MLVLDSPDRAPALTAQVESAAEARVVSHPHDSALALARAKVLLPDVLVADLSARFTPDSATGVHRARQLSPPCTVVVHGYGAVIGTIAEEGSVAPVPDSTPGTLARVQADGLLLAGFE
ncbi:hypothetical protein ACFRNJ_19585 [Streptomyces sp. NPDC056721]|uniref:hypothetical protein n=1 Tax=Streptomyces sp. NPDC056721 TaxID=3345923 RepID=UPI00369E2896